MASRSTTGEVCLGSDSFAEDEAGLGTQQLNQLETDVLGEARLRCLLIRSPPPVLRRSQSSHWCSQGCFTTLGASANDLLIPARLMLRTAMANGKAESAISSSFDASNQEETHHVCRSFWMEKRNQNSVGKFRPEENSGAFIASTNTILVGEELKDGGSKLDRVVLEEIGHWLEAELSTDSIGDEGEQFAKSSQDLIRRLTDQ